MKRFLPFFAMLMLASGYAFIPVADSNPAQENVEKSVLLWADKTFEYYDGVRFENFTVVPSNEQFIVETKIETLKEFKAEMKTSFTNGELKKTKEQFDTDQKKIDRKIDSLSIVLKNIDPAGKNYEIHFWSNILVSNAVTVYYQHLVKLNSKFEVTGVKITGAVGTQPKDVKILYKKSATIIAKDR